MTREDLLARAMRLPIADRAALAAELLESLDAPDLHVLPLPAWQAELLDEAVAEADARPGDCQTWREAKEQIRSKLRPPEGE